MRPWPKAPRACLLERMSFRLIISLDRDVMLRWAASMTASRSFNCPSDNAVRSVCSVRPEPTRWLTMSSRSSSVRCKCTVLPWAWAAKLCKEPVSSAKRSSRSAVRWLAFVCSAMRPWVPRHANQTAIANRTSAKTTTALIISKRLMLRWPIMRTGESRVMFCSITQMQNKRKRPVPT